MASSPEQLEARTQGTQEESVKYMTHHHFTAIFVFTLAIVGAAIWAEVIISLASKIYQTERSQFKLWH